MQNTPSLETADTLGDIAKEAVMLLTAAAMVFKLLGRHQDASDITNATLDLVERAEGLGLE